MTVKQGACSTVHYIPFRIWYGFKTKPELDLRILPYYGEIKLGENFLEMPLQSFIC